MSAWLQMHILTGAGIDDGWTQSANTFEDLSSKAGSHMVKEPRVDGKHENMQSAGWNGNLCPSCPVFKRQKSEVHWTSPRSSAFFVLTRELHGEVRSGPVRSGPVWFGAVRSSLVPRTSVLFCAASFYNSNVKKKSLLQDAAENDQSSAIFALQNIFFRSVKIARSVSKIALFLVTCKNYTASFYKPSIKKYQHRTFALEDDKVSGRTCADTLRRMINFQRH